MIDSILPGPNSFLDFARQYQRGEGERCGLQVKEQRPGELLDQASWVGLSEELGPRLGGGEQGGF